MFPARFFLLVCLHALISRVPAAETYESRVLPLMVKFCHDCHGDVEKPKGGANLERFRTFADTLRDRAIWREVFHKVEALQMPPPKEKTQPTPEERTLILTWIKDLAAAPDPVLGVRDPGKPVLRRLTRLEYNNIRDLFSLENDIFIFPERLPVSRDYFEAGVEKMPEPLNIFVREYGIKYPVLLPDAGLPGENRAEHGYSNRGEAMNLSPLLLENYLATARAIVNSPKLARQSPVFRDLARDPAAREEEMPPPLQLASGSSTFHAQLEFAPNFNLPRQVTKGGATVTYQFRFNTGSAARDGTGGIWQAWGKETSPAGTSIGVYYGGIANRALVITPREDLLFTEFPGAEATSDTSFLTNAVKGAKTLNFSLAIHGGERGEGIVDLGICVLSRRGEKGPVSLAVTFSGGRTHALTDNIPPGEGTGNTFFSFRAPDGEIITGLTVDGSGFSGDHILLDDLGFITNGGVGDPLEPVGKLARMSAKDKRAAAEERLAGFLPHIFRHPLNEAALPRYMTLYDAAIKQGRSFPSAMRDVLAAALSSPEFLYLTGPAPEKNEVVRELDPFELATRMAFFLWSSPPDDNLLRAALEGGLRNANGTSSEVFRMLTDPRVCELVESFAVQWLRLDQLYTAKPDPKLFPSFYYGENGKRTLHAPMLVEALLLFQTVLVEDRSILDFIDPGYTWLNVKMVRHYGLESREAARIKSLGLRLNTSDGLKDQRINNTWWRAKLPDKTRGGYLTMAGPLTVTSLPVRTSPVKRGAWLLETIFNRPPQEPKIAFVLKEDDHQAVATMSVRQRFEAHRNQPACYSCHVRLDPPGFALEAFDPVGAFRTKDAGQPVDSSAEWHGTAFTTPAGFKATVVANKDEFIRGFIEHLLSYALGRKLEIYDMPAVDEIQRAAAKDNYHLRRIITAIIESYPFRHTRTQ